MRVGLGDALSVDPTRRIVQLSIGEMPYDYLIVATGATHAYLGHDKRQPWAPRLKTLEDAIDIRHRVLLAFEWAEQVIRRNYGGCLQLWGLAGAHRSRTGRRPH